MRIKIILLLLLFFWSISFTREVDAQTAEILANSTTIGPISVTSNGTIFTYAPSLSDSITKLLSKIARDGSVSLVSFPGGHTYGIVALGSDHRGNLYFTTISEDATQFLINKIDSAGTVSFVTQFPLTGITTSDISSGTTSFTVDGEGNFYFYAARTNIINKIDQSGTVSVFKDFSTVTNYTLSEIFADSFGNIYGTLYITGGIYKISPNGVTSKIYTTDPTKQWLHVAADSSGNAYTYNLTDNQIIKITPSGGTTIVNPFGSNEFSARSLTVDGSDTLYIASSGLGATPRGTIGEVMSDGRTQILTPSRISGGSGIALDASETIYVSSQVDNAIVKIAPDGTVSTFVSAGLKAPTGIIFDKFGILYVADYGSNTIKKITPDGTVSIFVSTDINHPDALAFDAAGNLYVSNFGDNTIARVTPSGSTSIFSSSNHINGPVGITFDQGGNLYVTDYYQDTVVVIAPDGIVSPYLPTLSELGITTAPDGTVYAATGDEVVRVNPDGSLANTKVFSGVAAFLTADSIGNLYFVGEGSVVSKLFLAPSPLFAAILPGSRTPQPGSVATTFATMLNSGNVALTGCGISLPIETQGSRSLTYRTTDAATNVVTGAPNQPASIAAHGQQSFVLSLQSDRDTSASFIFSCTGSPPVASLQGVNTFDLFVRGYPLPDIIPIAVTQSQNGIVVVPQSHGQSAAFAVAGVNIGATATVTVSATPSYTQLPLTLNICETNPTNGQCLAPPAPSVHRNFPSNGAPATFSVFVSASGIIPLAPGSARIYVRFSDDTAETNASTSVAVMTQ
jgi:streptogramin lyase